MRRARLPILWHVGTNNPNLQGEREKERRGVRKKVISTSLQISSRQKLNISWLHKLQIKEEL